MLEPTYKKPSVQPHSYTLTSKKSLVCLISSDECYFMSQEQYEEFRDINEDGLTCWKWQVFLSHCGKQTIMNISK